ncbi:hypothetical protein BRADI_4g13902v3 [Brachypodium distachyon]|uniref:Uncharacterized protein n=1 Tax=Brachypodium distachyon TaxID=15368 RepID=A0A2K2CMP9_BRADI|nr:hypothetical protein BRADI_4g13902v3 [Brachypodium distachyon]
MAAVSARLQHRRRPAPWWPAEKLRGGGRAGEGDTQTAIGETSPCRRSPLGAGTVAGKASVERIGSGGAPAGLGEERSLGGYSLSRLGSSLGSSRSPCY